MNETYLFACGIVWQKTGDAEAGWELIEGLRSPDPYVNSLAAVVLVGTGLRSLELLETAVKDGILTPEQAAPCMMDILCRSASPRGPEPRPSPVPSVAMMWHNAGVVN